MSMDVKMEVVKVTVLRCPACVGPDKWFTYSAKAGAEPVQ